jgi:hypothetical protein
LLEAIGEDHVFPTVDLAVGSIGAVEQHKTKQGA